MRKRRNHGERTSQQTPCEAEYPIADAFPSNENAHTVAILTQQRLEILEGLESACLHRSDIAGATFQRGA